MILKGLPFYLIGKQVAMVAAVEARVVVAAATVSDRLVTTSMGI